MIVYSTASLMFLFVRIKNNKDMMAKELGLQTGDVMSRQRVFGVPLSNVPVDQNTKVFFSQIFSSQNFLFILNQSIQYI